MVSRALAGACLLLALGSAAALPVPSDNSATSTRPVAIGSSPEPTLQSILNNVYGTGGPSATANQSFAAVWGDVNGSGPNVTTLVAEYAALRNSNRFGIWFGTDSNEIYMLDLMLGSAAQGDRALITIGNGSIQLSANGGSTVCNIDILCGTFSDALINTGRFGFYFWTPPAGSGTAPYHGPVTSGFGRVFSSDLLSVQAGSLGITPTGELPRFLAYQGLTAATGNTWVYAYEDLAMAQSDRDFNDMVVRVTNIAPVPEPATVALLIAGLGVLGLMRRRARAVRPTASDSAVPA